MFVFLPRTTEKPEPDLFESNCRVILKLLLKFTKTRTKEAVGVKTERFSRKFRSQLGNIFYDQYDAMCDRQYTLLSTFLWTWTNSFKKSGNKPLR